MMGHGHCPGRRMAPRRAKASALRRAVVSDNPWFAQPSSPVLGTCAGDGSRERRRPELGMGEDPPFGEVAELGNALALRASTDMVPGFKSLPHRYRHRLNALRRERSLGAKVERASRTLDARAETQYRRNGEKNGTGRTWFTGESGREANTAINKHGVHRCRGKPLIDAGRMSGLTDLTCGPVAKPGIAPSL